MSKKKNTLASQQDIHHLYEESVQDAEWEVEFTAKQYKKVRGKPARILREDFCGTGKVACLWAEQHKENQAVGIDLESSVLVWGEENNRAALPKDAQARVSLVEGDVRSTESPPADLTLALNFSYWCFKSRKELLNYFRKVYLGLQTDGILVLDIFGGYEAFQELEEEREVDDFCYIWEQAYYEPVSGDYRCHIHFTFEDGSEIRNAFTYEWRLWTMPEIKELLHEAGFDDVKVYAQGFDEDGEGDGNYQEVNKIDADAGWICYLLALK